MSGARYGSRTARMRTCRSSKTCSRSASSRRSSPGPAACECGFDDITIMNEWQSPHLPDEQTNQHGVAPRGNHGVPDRAFSVWWRRRPTGSSDGPFSGGARSKRFPRQYTNICVCCSVARTITAHCYDAFAKRPVEFTPRSSQGAQVLSDVRASVSRSTNSWKVRRRWWLFSTEGSSEVFASSSWSSCRARIQSSSGAMSIC